MFLRVVYNREAERYEIHRGFFYVQVWGGGTDWWHLYPEHALRFLTPEVAIENYREYVQRVRDAKKKRRERVRKYKTYTWFW